MQAATPGLCSPTLPLFPPPPTPQRACTLIPSSPLKFPLQNHFRAITPLHSAATQEIAETAEGGRAFVEVGYLSSVHGLQGEICIKPNTDFPEQRFSKPGTRWLRQKFSGKDTYREVELVEGRGHPGRKSWILRFVGIDTVDEAKQLIGSTLLVREDDRPELEEGEFYTRDLVGMRVILKETGECMGTVVNVFDSGAQDLLHVMMYPPMDTPNGTEKPAETRLSGHLAWVPFVEAIVPDVDITKRELRITPPKGLLELNLRVDERSKKERRQLEWKERKKFQRRLIAAKKKLCEMEQKHVFHGLRYGDKSQRSLLADQIVGVNSKLFRHALQNLGMHSQRWSVTEIISATRTSLIRNTLKVPKECLTASGTEEDLGSNFKFQEKGLRLLSKGKIAIVLVVNDIVQGGGDLVVSGSTMSSPFPFNDETFVKVEDRPSVPLVVVCPRQEILSLKTQFLSNDYFAFDPNKVWFLEEESLPVVNSDVEEQNRHKILMKSPWEVLQSPVGSGGVISLLSSHNIPENLGAMGVEYFEICCTSQKCGAGNPLLLGFSDSHKAEVGILICSDMKDAEESFNMVFSLKFMKLLTKESEKLQFLAIPKLHAHVKMVEKEWIDAVPSSPNSYELHCSIYSSLNACPLEKMCVMDVAE